MKTTCSSLVETDGIRRVATDETISAAAAITSSQSLARSDRHECDDSSITMMMSGDEYVSAVCEGGGIISVT